ncbi:MAG: hypothetical protein LIQ31_07175 [Planctomycetes bacterium]|nr:hypothetical protein [Planctomycetota bacterium]
MKHFYINSVINSIAMAAGPDEPGTWLFSCGDRWLLLTPPRLQRLALLLGIRDRRIAPLVTAVRRESPWASQFSARLGLSEPERTVPVLCPRCDGLHEAHSDDINLPCPDCRRREEEKANQGPTPPVLRDQDRDREVRNRLAETDPFLFHNGELSPNWKYNASRRLELDWDAAAQRVHMGARYRQVARELGCSVGILHREVKRREYWEDN